MYSVSSYTAPWPSTRSGAQAASRVCVLLLLLLHHHHHHHLLLLLLLLLHHHHHHHHHLLLLLLLLPFLLLLLSSPCMPLFARLSSRARGASKHRRLTDDDDVESGGFEMEHSTPPELRAFVEEQAAILSVLRDFQEAEATEGPAVLTSHAFSSVLERVATAQHTQRALLQRLDPKLPVYQTMLKQSKAMLELFATLTASLGQLASDSPMIRC
ncbi:hypothetical protein AB1Y20_013669 [Prymnesium parvum]|uniref:Uncharacterized protein n=1 Tax=Prymnesium parvum TaxID=97485 RepID=A0AB34IFS0_PRYPA